MEAITNTTTAPKRETLEEKIAKIRANAAEEEAKAVKGETILGLLPDWALECNHTSPFWHRLYGHEVSIKWRANRYSSLPGGSAPDLEFVKRLAAEFPPLPMVLVEDGCKSFRQANASGDRGTITPVAPFVVRVDLNDGCLILITWESMVGEFCAQLTVAVPMPSRFGHADTQRSREIHGRSIVERCNLVVKVPGARSIKWARGSNEYYNDFTVYWLDPQYTLAEMLESIAPVEGEARG
jgi:hypothetical protein